MKSEMQILRFYLVRQIFPLVRNVTFKTLFWTTLYVLLVDSRCRTRIIVNLMAIRLKCNIFFVTYYFVKWPIFTYLNSDPLVRSWHQGADNILVTRGNNSCVVLGSPRANWYRVSIIPFAALSLSDMIALWIVFALCVFDVSFVLLDVDIFGSR